LGGCSADPDLAGPAHGSGEADDRGAFVVLGVEQIGVGSIRWLDVEAKHHFEYLDDGLIGAVKILWAEKLFRGIGFQHCAGIGHSRFSWRIHS
jgi:hypothetical protein